MQLVLTIILYAWLFAVLALLYLIWRNGVERLSRLQSAIIDVSNKSAEAAKTAADAAQKAVAFLEKKP